MGAPRGEFKREFASNMADEPPDGPPPGATSRDVSSRSSHLIVSVSPHESDADEYHTTRLCPAYPVPAESMGQEEAEKQGHSFCWTCFELEMRALGE